MTKSLHHFGWVAALTLLPIFVLLTLVAGAVPAGELPYDNYLPLVVRPATSTPGAPTVTTTTLTIPSYDLEAGFIPTTPGDPVYPYPRLNHDQVWFAPMIARTFTAVILQNDYIAITVLPELGGRLYRFVDKTTGRNLLYENPVLKPTSWGYRGWWLATGGIEWAFPVDEHGLNEYRPWRHTITQTATTAQIALSDVESRTGMAVGVVLTLDAAHNSVTIEPWAHNDTATFHPYQYWINAMIALDDNRASSQTEFVVPAPKIQVHSTGDPTLPQPGDWLSWPIYNSRDLSLYGNWSEYIGFFAQAADLSAGFTAVYDHGVDQGIVRVFDHTQVAGHKYFGLANLRPTNPADPSIWSDANGGDYVEMWGGYTTDFWTYEMLAPGAEIRWQERWYPLAGTGGVDAANETAVLRLHRDGSAATVAAASTTPFSGTLRLSADGVSVAEWPVTLSPGQPFSQQVVVNNGTLTLTLLDNSNTVVLTVED